METSSTSIFTPEKEEKAVRKYEMLFVLDPNLTKEGLDNLIKRIEEEITKNKGKIEDIAQLGRKRLAYEIKGNMDGLYVSFTLQAEPPMIESLKEKYKRKQDILRYMIFKK